MDFIRLPELPHQALWRPAVDVYECADGWLVKFDLSGVPPEEVEISVRDRCLTVSGVRRDWIGRADHRCYSMEICYSRFQRSVELPGELDEADIALDYRYGMLLVRLQTRRES